MIHLIANPAINQWNYSFKCGAPLKIVQWTELYTSGDAPELVVKAKMAGMSNMSHEDLLMSIRGSKPVSYDDDISLN